MKRVFFAAVFTLFICRSIYAQPDWCKNWNSALYYAEYDKWMCEAAPMDGSLSCFIADKNGNILHGPFPGYVRFTDDDDRYIIYSGGDERREGVFAADGSPVIPMEYRYITKIKGMNIYAAEKDNNEGLIDEKGNVLLPFDYSYIADEFKNGLLLVSVYEQGVMRWGFINEDFSTAAEPEYEDYAVCGDRSYLFKNNDAYEVGSDGVKLYRSGCGRIYGDGDDCLTFVQSDGDMPKYGKVDKNLDTVIPAIADEDFAICGNYAIVKTGSTGTSYVKGIGDVPDGKYGVIDFDGNFRTANDYDKIVFMGNGRFVCIKDGKRELVSLDSPFEWGDADEWAREDVGCGIWTGLVPKELQSSFRADITRREFCILAVNTYLHNQYYIE